MNCDILNLFLVTNYNFNIDRKFFNEVTNYAQNQSISA